MYKVQIANRQQLLPIDSKWLKKIVEATLRAENVESAEIDVAIVDDAEIHTVNREHLEHDYPTDVISFLYSADEERPIEPGDGDLRGAGLALEGELVVSAETAIRVAQEFEWQPEAELTLYVVHGLLHLCGYDDLTEEEHPIMRGRERDILKIWNLTPHYQE